MSGSVRHHTESGQGLVEYALLLMLVSVIVVAALALVGNSTGNLFSNVACNLNRDTQCQPLTNSNSSQNTNTNSNNGNSNSNPTGSGNCGNGNGNGNGASNGCGNGNSNPTGSGNCGNGNGNGNGASNGCGNGKRLSGQRDYQDTEFAVSADSAKKGA